MKAIRKEVLVVLCCCLIPVMTVSLWSRSWSDTAEQGLLDHLSTTYDPCDQQGFHPPLSRLTYTGQTGPTSEYTVTGFPGCAPPGSQIICQFPDGSQALVDTASADGSFRFAVPYAKDSSRKSLRVMAADQQGHLSAAAQARTDYPLMSSTWNDSTPQGGADGYRGWYRLTVASIDEQEDLQAWKELRAATEVRNRKIDQWAKRQGKTSRELWKEGIEPPDSLRGHLPVSGKSLWVWEQPTPQDLKIYGYTPAGELVTCILPVDSSSFVQPIRPDGTFSIVIAREKVAADVEGQFPFTVNITDRHNGLLASTAVRVPPPKWADKSRDRTDERFEQMEADQRTALIGHQAPDFTLERTDGKGTMSLKSLRGKTVLINIWARGCGGCIQEMPAIEKLHSVLQQRGIVLLTVNPDDSVKVVQSFMRTKGYTFPVLSDLRRTMVATYKFFAKPTTIVVDPAGIIRFLKLGPMTEVEFWAALRKGGVE